MADKLLAKSPRNGVEKSLVRHTRDVIDAAVALFGSADGPTRLGHCWLRFFKLPDEAWPTFYINLLASCALHDWGKANDGFQDDVRGKRGSQGIRHEHLSALLMSRPVVWEWLAGNVALDRPLVLSAVMTHHLKAAYDPHREFGFARRMNDRARIGLLHRTDQFEELAGATGDLLGLGQVNLREIPEAWSFEKPPANIREMRKHVIKEVFNPFRNELDANLTRKRMLLAVRGGLIAADAAGSGLARVDKTIPGWIRQQFDAGILWDGERVRTEIINRRVDDLNAQFRKHGKGKFEWNDFQVACDDLPDRALLLAPCGSGKTLAAWRWIAAQAAKNPAGHVLFLYPTRATAKEGFKDYVSWAPEADAALMHGTAEFDLRDMFDNEQDSRHGLSYEADRRLYALGFWEKRAFSATVDQFLAFLQYGYGPVCMLPVLADSIIVIDEVHSFDQKMFSALKAFLNNFNVPVLCMTATLPPDRRDQLEKSQEAGGCGLTVFAEKRGELETIAGMPRYRLTRAASRNAAEERAREALRSGRRVLWVVNTVARCHEIVERFAANFDPASKNTHLTMADGTPVYCYHSRFKLSDRVKRHNNVVDNLKATGGAGIGITTQVCEMSLDLDVDLLITEECPVTSLIQRMGRANRERDARPLSKSGEVIVYKPADQNPYSREDLTGLEEFLALVADTELSQAALEEALSKVPSPPWGGDKLSMFLESGPFAVAGDEDFRDSEEHNRQCVLPDDVHDYLSARAKDKPGFILPVPIRLARCRDNEMHPEHKQLPPYLGIAEAGHYHPAIGFYGSTLDQWGQC
ncbi:MAG TPA: CRISPR-associated helicase Cas3' [Pirellulales bacterium]|nr:CRISPR-associated helicase Cas3' [Pirellulales bacterium]